MQEVVSRLEDICNCKSSVVVGATCLVCVKMCKDKKIHGETTIIIYDKFGRRFERIRRKEMIRLSR